MKKNFILGISIALIIGSLGLAWLINDISKNDAQISRNCTWSQVKDCASGNAGPNNPCCPPKFHMELARNCSWSEVKDCYSGNTNPNNPCCPPKFHEALEMPML